MKVTTWRRCDSHFRSPHRDLLKYSSRIGSPQTDLSRSVSSQSEPFWFSSLRSHSGDFPDARQLCEDVLSATSVRLFVLSMTSNRLERLHFRYLPREWSIILSSLNVSQI